MSAMKEWLEQISEELGYDGEINDAVIAEGQKRMNFQPGELVKVRTQINPECWRTATYLKKEDDFYSLVQYDQIFPPFRIITNGLKRLQSLPDDAEDEMIRRDLQPALEMLRKGLEALLPGEPVCVEGNVISLYHGSVTMEPTIYEIHTIGSFREHAGWSITVWKNHPSTQYEPEDVSDSLVGNYPSYQQAVQKLIEVAFLHKCKDFWENSAYISMYMEPDW